MVSESFAATSLAIRSASLRESHPRKMVSATMFVECQDGVNVTPFRRGFHPAQQCKNCSRSSWSNSIEGFHSRISLER